MINDVSKNFEGDGTFWLATFLPMVLFNAADGALNEGGFACMERDISIDMEGTNSREVGW